MAARGKGPLRPWASRRCCKKRLAVAILVAVSVAVSELRMIQIVKNHLSAAYSSPSDPTIIEQGL